jgi:hypothetical protein
LLSVGLNLSITDGAAAGLWLAVILSGFYHGVNPGMGWPLAVSAGLMQKSPSALGAALWALAAGHLLAMLLVLLPFSLLAALVEWRGQIQVGASLFVIGFGISLFIRPRHPRALARIRPTQLGLWSFAVALAHGAALMLVPIYLGLCQSLSSSDQNSWLAALLKHDLNLALSVAIIHSIAMIAAGGVVAWLVYRYLGLKFLSRSWFNLDAAWAASLILIGSAALAATLLNHH